MLLVCGKLACKEDPADDSNPFREDVVRCEDALAHLATCCPEVKPAADACSFSHHEDVCGGCTGQVGGHPATQDVWPVLSIVESQRIEIESCAFTDCTKAAELVARKHSSQTEGMLECN